MPFGTYPTSSTAARMRRRVSSGTEMAGLLLNTYETVACETLASLATSACVGLLAPEEREPLNGTPARFFSSEPGGSNTNQSYESLCSLPSVLSTLFGVDWWDGATGLILGGDEEHPSGRCADGRDGGTCAGSDGAKRREEVSCEG